MLDFQIHEFWQWFVKHSDQLESDSYDISSLEKLDKTIVGWQLVWEIGPGLTKPNSLTISPNGNYKLLDQTSMIINSAPALDTWEFYAWKQAKENWYIANLISENLEINATEWLYTLLRYPDGTFEILIKADNLKSFGVKTRELAVDLILTNLLGEKRKMEELYAFEIVDEFDQEKGVTELKFLPAHMHKVNNSV